MDSQNTMIYASGILKMHFENNTQINKGEGE